MVSGWRVPYFSVRYALPDHQKYHRIINKPVKLNMKKKRMFSGLIFGLLVCMTVIYTGCKKDNNGSDADDIESGTIIGKIDGRAFTSPGARNKAHISSLGNGRFSLTIQGSGGYQGSSITLIINGINGKGVYPIGGGSHVSVSASYMEVDPSNPAATKTWKAPFDETAAGEINISQFSETVIKGTFHFTAENTSNGGKIVVSEGAMNMKPVNYGS
jgi:hypothetical protein